MIKVKLQELVNSASALKNLGDKPLRGKLAYKIGKIIQQVSNELQLYDNARKEMFTKYCIKDENGEVKIDENGNVQVPREHVLEYTKEIKKLDETEIELNAILLDLDDFDTIEMTPKEMTQLEWIIKKQEA